MTTTTVPETEFESFANILAGGVRLIRNLGGNSKQFASDFLADGKAVAEDVAVAYEFAVAGGTAARDAWRSAPRTSRIVRETTMLIAAWKWYQMREPHMSDERRQHEADRIHNKYAVRLYNMCNELQGGVLKLGQLLSCRRDLLPEPYIRELSRLQDQAPAESWESVERVFQESFGQMPSDMFDEFESEPVAAASLAQVHRARLADGTVVAVKVQREGIADILETDIHALQVVLRMMKSIVPWLDADIFIGEIIRSLRAELDFDAERLRMQQFAALCASNREVVVPPVYEQYGSATVLTMGFVEGSRLTDWLDQHRNDPAQINRLLSVMTDSFCAQVLEYGVFHADPHPGNFLVTADGKLVLLDFGCVQEFPESVRRNYVMLCMAALGNNRPEMLRLLGELGFRTAGDDPEAILGYADLLLEEFRRGEMFDFAQLNMQAKIADALELTQAAPISAVPAEAVMLGRMLAAIGGLVIGYGANLDLAAHLMPYLMKNAA